MENTYFVYSVKLVDGCGLARVNRVNVSFYDLIVMLPFFTFIITYLVALHPNRFIINNRIMTWSKFSVSLLLYNGNGSVTHRLCVNPPIPKSADHT